MKFSLFILLNISFITILKSSELDSLIKVDSINYNDYLISKITIKGNKITKDEVIIRELNLLPGNKFDSTLYVQDFNNLTNLRIFNKIQQSLNPNFENKTLEYIIEVDEAINILPLPQGGMKEGSLKKIWAGVNFQWKNFRGMNETLGLNFGIGYEPFISVSYFNPWISKKEHFFTSFNFTYSKNIKRLIPDSISNIQKDNAYEYTLHKYYTEILIGKFFFKYLKFYADISYNLNNIAKSNILNNFTNIGDENYTKLSLGIIYDKRNDVNYTTHGTYIDFSYSRYGIFSEKVQFNKLELGIKKFIPIRIIKDYFVAYSFFIRSANIFGNVPPDYLLEVYGYDLYIRGWKDYLFKGENSFGMFSEFRIPIIKPFYVEGKNHFIIKAIPFFKNLNYKYGLYLITFFDIGTVYNRNVKISGLVFKKGYGIGVNILLPFNFIVRVDFAFNKEIEKFKSRFSFDLNPFF